MITFLVTLSIVIAVFYTDNIALGPLAAAGGLFVLLLAFNMSGIRKTVPYLIITMFLWYALMQSDVLATLAGILGALSVPATPKDNPEHFSEYVRELMKCFDASHQPGKSIMTNDKLCQITSG